jgi:hypothetical protein
MSAELFGDALIGGLRDRVGESDSSKRGLRCWMNG